ncbi:hypothetical protein BS639_17135 [Rouxiella silvae]|uniref:Uncharacterized protein n=1 Tax=Rouxiella silvae TaxID=1646373 RepID=A0ABX3TXU7_9GAMM|nr:hypothetical protein [Rouxiella silvae]ORJ20018.1 hypothetical protein BS639_17135 [Rouxiella silvae]
MKTWFMAYEYTNEERVAVKSFTFITENEEHDLPKQVDDFIRNEAGALGFGTSAIAVTALNIV